MKAFAIFGLIGLIITFLTTVLNGFPLSATPLNTGTSLSGTDSLDVNNVQQVGNQFLSMYCSVVEDIASFQQDPSVERAVARRDAFLKYGKDTASNYQTFTTELTENFNQLNQGISEESTE